jgi:hypothetical protein
MSAHASTQSAGCLFNRLPLGMRGGPTQTIGSKTLSEVPCARCWKRASISDTRPATGTPRWGPSSSGNATRSISSTLKRRCPSIKRPSTSWVTLTANGGRILFVGTKRAAREAIQEEATRCGMPYVNHRWLGGMLTNFKTIRHSVKRLKELETMFAEGHDRALQQEGSAGSCARAREARAEHRRHQGDGRPAGRHVRDRCRVMRRSP